VEGGGPLCWGVVQGRGGVCERCWVFFGVWCGVVWGCGFFWGWVKGGLRLAAEQDECPNSGGRAEDRFLAGPWVAVLCGLAR
jgi:hypothetical protein